MKVNFGCIITPGNREGYLFILSFNIGAQTHNLALAKQAIHHIAVSPASPGTRDAVYKSNCKVQAHN